MEKLLSKWISAFDIVIMTPPVILISDNLRSEKIDCACQVVEIDLLGSTQARSQVFSKGGLKLWKQKP